MLARERNKQLYMKRKRMATRLEDVEKKMLEENKSFDFWSKVVILLTAIATLMLLMSLFSSFIRSFFMILIWLIVWAHVYIN